MVYTGHSDILEFDFRRYDNNQWLRLGGPSRSSLFCWVVPCTILDPGVLGLLNYSIVLCLTGRLLRQRFRFMIYNTVFATDVSLPSGCFCIFVRLLLSLGIAKVQDVQVGLYCNGFAKEGKGKVRKAEDRCTFGGRTVHLTNGHVHFMLEGHGMRILTTPCIKSQEMTSLLRMNKVMTEAIPANRSKLATCGLLTRPVLPEKMGKKICKHGHKYTKNQKCNTHQQPPALLDDQ
uniref:Uncharacterized protein n=1 Tax=Glossina brevipalpis TaxID=37001 RepID=A0A1A9WFL2_9MUSC